MTTPTNSEALPLTNCSPSLNSETDAVYMRDDLLANLFNMRTFAGRMERERNALIFAIRKHRDTFPDEVCEGERELWAAIPEENAKSIHPESKPNDHE